MPDEPKTTTWPEGLNAAIEAMKPMVLQSYEVQAETQRRLWSARDEVDRLKRLLVVAEVALEAAERDYEHNGEEMTQVWDHFANQVKKIPNKVASR